MWNTVMRGTTARNMHSDFDYRKQMLQYWLDGFHGAKGTIQFRHMMIEYLKPILLQFNT